MASLVLLWRELATSETAERAGSPTEQDAVVQQRSIDCSHELQSSSTLMARDSHKPLLRRLCVFARARVICPKIIGWS